MSKPAPARALELPRRISHILTDVDGVLTTGLEFNQRLLSQLARHANKGVYLTIVTGREASRLKEILGRLKDAGLDDGGLEHLQLLGEDGRVSFDPKTFASQLTPLVAGHPLTNKATQAQMVSSLDHVPGLEFGLRESVVAVKLGHRLEENPERTAEVSTTLTRWLKESGMTPHVDMTPGRAAFMLAPKIRGVPITKSHGARAALETVAAKTGRTLSQVARHTIVLGDNARDFEMSRPRGMRRPIPGYFAGSRAALARMPQAEQQSRLVATARGVPGAMEADAVEHFLASHEPRFKPFPPVRGDRA